MQIFGRYSLMFFAFLIPGLMCSTGVFAQPPMGGSQDKQLVAKFDVNQDGFLNTEERAEARKFWEEKQKDRPQRRPRNRGQRASGKPGKRISPDQVENFPKADLFDRSVLRTIFLEFESDDWEKELELFKPTDVEVPATMTVDGKEYSTVGVSFRGASSFFMIPAGLKRSLNISMDLANDKQSLNGYKSLNLLNINGDPSMMSSLLYSIISSQRIPTPKVNYVKVVINGESWGIYVNSQQINKVFINQGFSTKKGYRWKVPGSPRGDGGLRYVGDEIEPYRERFEIKSSDKPESWNALINLCRVLNETPEDQLEEALEPILDVQGCLWFLAVDLALSNSDGYWTRASDYYIYCDPTGKFHILPHDMNEAFRFARRRRRGGGGPKGRPRNGPPKGGPPRNGPPRGGPPGGFGAGGGPELDPLYGIDDERMPLRSVLLKNPAFQKQYLENLRAIAEMLKWENLGSEVAQARTLIEVEVELDTRKLTSFEAFQAATDPAKPRKGSTSLRSFTEQRSAFLLSHPKISNLPKTK